MSHIVIVFHGAISLLWVMDQDEVKGIGLEWVIKSVEVLIDHFVLLMFCLCCKPYQYPILTPFPFNSKDINQ